MSNSLEWLDETVQIPDLLHAAPQVRPILDRYGLHGCGGEFGPPESLAFFARAHEAPLDTLLREIRECVNGSPSSAVEEQAEVKANPLADTIYRPFFKSGILVVLTLGAVWGAYLLLRIAWTGRFAAASLHEINAHGHAQIFGWVGLFVMGFAYQAFPRFKNTVLAFPRLALLTLGLMLLGVIGRSVSEPLADVFAWTGSLALVSAWVEVAAIALFAVIILATWRGSGKGWDFHDYYILSALGWFLFQAVAEAVYLAATLAAANHDELVNLVSMWQGAIREAQIHGFALLMILGVSQRILHHIFAFPAPSRRLSLIALPCLNLAVVGEMAGLVLMRGACHAWCALWYGSALVLTGVVAALVWNWRIFGRVEEADRSIKFIRAAYAWLLISLSMVVLLPLYQFVVLPRLAPGSEAAATFSHAYYGAVRHAITVGFISLMIVAVSSRVVPMLNGVDRHRVTPLWGAFVLLNLGCTLRVVSQVATDITPHAYIPAGFSGLLEVTGLALWAAHIWSIMSGRVRLHGEAAMEGEAYCAGVPIAAGHRVGEVLDAYPALLDVFRNLGFRSLSNPLMRRTVARRVTIGQACRFIGRDEEGVLAALNRAAGLPVNQTFSLSVLSSS